VRRLGGLPELVRSDPADSPEAAPARVTPPLPDHVFPGQRPDAGRRTGRFGPAAHRV